MAVNQELASRLEWVHYLVHDIRSPVTVALCGVELALERGAHHGNGETVEALQHAVTELVRVRGMLQDLLDVNRFRLGVLSLASIHVDLAAVANEVAGKLQFTARSRNLTIAVEAADHATTHADPEILRRVFTNLLDNAIRYARRRVSVHVGRAPDAVVVFVANDGPEIWDHIQHRIFEPWSVLAPGGPSHGTGLGLAFCRIALEAHHGRIWIERADEGDVIFAFAIPHPG
jgi:signal transduction histidine kinase